MKLFQHLPNALTCANLLCGCIGVVAVVQHDWFLATALVWLAAIFDFFDGFVARLLKAHSQIGKELDSLADMVTFGFLPAFFMFYLIKDNGVEGLWPYLAFSIAITSSLRLAIFNVDTRQSDAFIGLPTPANALFITALPFLYQKFTVLTPILTNGYVLIAIALLMAYLLVAPVKLIALKFTNASWQDNSMKFTLIGLSFLALLFFQQASIPLIILLYLTLSIIDNYLINRQAS